MVMTVWPLLAFGNVHKVTTRSNWYGTRRGKIVVVKKKPIEEEKVCGRRRNVVCIAMCGVPVDDRRSDVTPFVPYVYSESAVSDQP